MLFNSDTPIALCLNIYSVFLGRKFYYRSSEWLVKFYLNGIYDFFTCVKKQNLQIRICIGTKHNDAVVLN
ncbi:hypothetical protein C472_02414 [Halorubrum tebenquichense DSM 14210]|uniref:Uncharacterized protein n=1 Tax=Halorubrum tebenquichense DSM 14210 TaxID=1227485 RepID=M0DYT5_9EURY|nr:hypothetical protein C472_02414 [Halorubrum tebenquichense DSM 14210]